MQRKLAVSFLASLAAILTFSLAVSAAPSAPADPPSSMAFDQMVISQVDVSQMAKNMRALIDIGPRVAASPEERKGADYIKAAFQSYGYEPQMQYVPTTGNYVAYLRTLTPSQQDVWLYVGSYGSAPRPLSPEGGITGEVIDCGLGNSPADFPAAVAGDIALVKRAEGEGNATVTQKIRNAQAAGAAVALVQNYTWMRFSASTGGDASITIPFATMNSEMGAILQQPGTTANFALKRFTGSYNVIATKKPTNKNRDTGKVLVVSGHYDSVPTVGGADDNLSGTVVAMELARVIGSLPVDTEVRFAAWTGEEGGLIGSRYYVSQLTPEEKARHQAAFHMDMICNNWEEGGKLWILNPISDPANPGQPLSHIASETTYATMQRFGIVGTPTYGGTAVQTGSDHRSFGEAGIPAVNTSWRKAPMEREPWYHQPWDNMEVNFSPERIKLGAQVVGASVYDLARPDTPALTNSATR